MLGGTVGHVGVCRRHVGLFFTKPLKNQSENHFVDPKTGPQSPQDWFKTGTRTINKVMRFPLLFDPFWGPKWTSTFSKVFPWAVLSSTLLSIGPKMAAKTVPRGLLGPQEQPKTPQDRPKRAQDHPKIVPRAPESSKERSRSFKMTPSSSQGLSKVRPKGL